MMKVFLQTLAILLLVSSCTTNFIRTKNDKYQKNVRVVLEQSFWPLDSEVKGLVKIAVEKTKEPDAASQSTMYLSFDSPLAHDLGRDFFIDVDNEIFKLSFLDQIALNKFDSTTSSSTTSTTNTTTKKDSEPSTADKKAKEKTTTETETIVTVSNEKHEYNLIHHRGKYILSNALIEAILNGHTMTIQFYLEREPIALIITPIKFKRWQDFLAF